MMLVKTYVAPSDIEGLGLFAAEKILRGTPMQVENPIFDIVLTKPQVNALMPIARAHIEKYAWPDEQGLLHIGVDNDKYVNHSADPNMGAARKGALVCVALCDIEAGDEIVESYDRYNYTTVPPKS